jgi:predicted permease
VIKRLFRFPRRTPQEIRAEVDEELRFHLESRAEDLLAQGLSAEAARARALREFGDVEDARRALDRLDRGSEAAGRRRDVMGEIVQDLKYAARSLRTAPAFAATAVLTLALGIGANTAIFSVVDAVLLRPLPFPAPEQLVKLWSANPAKGERKSGVSPVDLDDWRAQRRTLADIGGYWYAEGGSGVDLTGSGEPRRLSAAFVSPGFFTTLGVNAARGRLPREEEMVRGGDDAVAVLAHGFWLRQFGGAEAAVGSTITLNGAPFVVLGVMPPSFRFPSPRVDVFVPYSTIPDTAIPRIRPVRILDVVGRLRPEATLAEARAEMNAIARSLAQQYPEDAAYGAATVEPLHEALTGRVKTGLLVLLGAVAFVLLMASVNVASLLLARATVRAREVAIRSALGAGRGRILRQLLTESLFLALLGGLAGIGVAHAGARALLALGANELPTLPAAGLDGRVLAYALVVSLATALVFGTVPALRSARADLQGALRDGGRGAAGGASRLRSALVVAEVALAMVLVMGAGLMTRSFLRLLDVDPGFRPERLLAVNFTISTERHPQYARFYGAVIDRVRALPGVTAAGAVKDAPFRGNGERNGFLLPGMTLRPGEEGPIANVLHVSDGYFNALGTRLVEGREFTRDDGPGKPFVAVVNEAFVRTHLGGGGAVGKVVLFGRGREVPIIGVVEDIRQVAIDEPARPTLYVHNQQNTRVKTTLVARTRGEPLALAGPIREAIWSLDKDQTITAIFTFDDLMNEAVARPRLITVLLGLFGALGLGLGALGIYGVLAYLVSQRRREIGVRIALGARPGDVLRLVVGRAALLALLGSAAGLLGALVLTRSMQGILYGVAPTDPLTLVSVSAVLLLAAALASWAPARQAARVDPAVALRAD